MPEGDINMIIGIPREIKNNENRVALVPSGVRTLAENGHQVIVQKSAGEASGISDAEYTAAGARVVPSAAQVFQEADIIVKVKEPLPQEYQFLRKGQVVFTFLHLAAAPELTKALLEREIVGIANETVQLANGTLPLLMPMSEIAGKLSIQIGAHYLEKVNGGSGILLGGVPGVKPANVAIIGGGTVGLNAAKIALGMGAHTSILDVSPERLRYLSDILHGNLTLLISNTENVENVVAAADLLIGALLVPGAMTRKLVSRSMISKMRKGSVVVDVAIDQGGCFETSHPTTFENPTFLIEGVVHFCVTNLPGCVASTSTLALTNATFPYILKLANMGYDKAMIEDISLRRGLNVFKGQLTSQPVAEAVGIKYVPFESIFKL
jgi:alanine dehydrogenase